jgi:DNA polymerase III epsilon subunit-like protein
MSKLLVLDTETGGVDPDRHSLLSIGAVVWEDGRQGAELEVLVAEPDFIVTARAMEINRIDLVAHSRQAVAPADALAILTRFVVDQFRQELASGEKVVLAGHNIGFDVGFLKRLFRAAGSDFEALFSHRSLDTASVLRFLSLAGMVPEAAAASNEAFRYLKIEISEADRHTALGDARATAELLTRLVELMRGAGVTRSNWVAA